MPILPLMLITLGGYLVFCGITNRNPADTLKQLLTDGTMPDAGSQDKSSTFKPSLPPGYNPLGPGGTETPYDQQHPTGPIV